MRIGPVGQLEHDRVPFQRDRPGHQGQLRGRVERLARDQVEARQVEGTGQRVAGQEAVIELEVLVRADALERMEAVPMDEQDVGAVDLDHEHRALRHLLDRARR